MNGRGHCCSQLGLILWVLCLPIFSCQLGQQVVCPSPGVSARQAVSSVAEAMLGGMCVSAGVVS